MDGEESEKSREQKDTNVNSLHGALSGLHVRAGIYRPSNAPRREFPAAGSCKNKSNTSEIETGAELQLARAV